MTPQLLSGLALSSWLFGVIHGCTQVGPAGWLIVIGIFYSHYYIKFPNSRHCEDIPQVGFFSLFHVSESCAFWTLCFASVTSCVFYSFTDPTMRWRSSGLSLFLLLSIFVLKSATELRICAYNVQKFDSAKASDERLMHYLKLVTHTLLCILYYIFSCCRYEWIIGRIGSGAVFMTRPMTFFLCAHVSVQVLTRCDISLLQHVVDPDGRAIETLLSVLNR